MNRNCVKTGMFFKSIKKSLCRKVTIRPINLIEAYYRIHNYVLLFIETVRRHGVKTLNCTT